MHWWYGHVEARRVADCSSGILLREGKREIGQASAWKFEEKIIQFLFVESISIYIRDL